MSDLGTAIVGLAIAAGIAAVVVPVVPGALLVWAAIAVWAFVTGSTTAFAALAAATVRLGGAQVAKLLVPGRRLLDAGVPRRSILLDAGVPRRSILAGTGVPPLPPAAQACAGARRRVA